MAAQKNVNECNEDVTATITPDIIQEYLSGKPHDLPETLTLKEVIERLNEWSGDRRKSSEHTRYMNVDADICIDVDIEFDDVREFAFESDKNFDEVEEMVIEKISNLKTPFKVETVYDEMKIEIMSKAMDKYTLDQLERRLGLDWL